jgi:hypothetical protein
VKGIGLKLFAQLNGQVGQDAPPSEIHSKRESDPEIVISIGADVKYGKRPLT